MSNHQNEDHQQGGKQPWLNSLWDCFSPCGLSLEACCVPCITYGKTGHRMSNHGNMDDYSCCNVDCMIYCVASSFGVWCIPMTIQAGSIREKYNLAGSFCGDLCKGTCCSCCALIQYEKEVTEQENLLRDGRQAPGQYGSQAPMQYGRQKPQDPGQYGPKKS